MEPTTRRTRRRPSTRPRIEVLLPRPLLPSRTIPNCSASPAAPAPPELDQLAAIARELGRWWV